VLGGKGADAVDGLLIQGEYHCRTQTERALNAH
jgi:hypothetical protein